jgi:hypothetical protein
MRSTSFSRCTACGSGFAATTVLIISTAIKEWLISSASRCFKSIRDHPGRTARARASTATCATGTCNYPKSITWTKKGAGQDATRNSELAGGYPAQLKMYSNFQRRACRMEPKPKDSDATLAIRGSTYRNGGCSKRRRAQ